MSHVNDFPVSDLTDNEMNSIHRLLESVNDLMVQARNSSALPYEYKEVLASLYLIGIRTEGVLDTLIAELDYLRRPWYKKLFRK